MINAVSNNDGLVGGCQTFKEVASQFSTSWSKVALTTSVLAAIAFSVPRASIAMTLSANYFVSVFLPVVLPITLVLHAISPSVMHRNATKAKIELSGTTISAAVLYAPIFEEIIFRGILNPVMGSGIGSAMFGLAHLIGTDVKAVNLWHVAQTGLSGFLLYSPICAQYGLFASMCAHAFNNFAIVSGAKLVQNIVGYSPVPPKNNEA